MGRSAWLGRRGAQVSTFSHVCPVCGFGLPVDVEICPHHTQERDDWAVGNKAWCDFFHRGQVRADGDVETLVWAPTVYNWEEQIQAALVRAAQAVRAALAVQPRGA